MVVASEFHLTFFCRVILFILIYAHINVKVKGARLQINDLRSTDFEGNGLNFEVYQRSNLKVKNNRATKQRRTVPEEPISDQLKTSKLRSAYLQSTKDKNGTKNIVKSNLQNKLSFSKHPTTAVSTLKTSSRKKVSVTTNSEATLKGKTKSKKRLKVSTTPTKKIILKTNSKKHKTNKKQTFITVKTSTSKRRLVTKNSVIEKSTTKNIEEEDDEDKILKNAIKTKAINKALDLFSKSLVKSLSDQLWDQFVIKSKKSQNSKYLRNKENSKVLQEKPSTKILRNTEKPKAPRKTENLKAIRQIDESVERFEIIL